MAKKKTDRALSYKKLDHQIAGSLGSALRLLANDFWNGPPARIKSISLEKEDLILRLPFLNPLPTGDSGDRLASQQDIDRIRRGFVEFLRERNSAIRNLSNLVYSEFCEYLRLHEFRHFDVRLRKMIPTPGGEPFTGRPSLPIPDSKKEEVRREVNAIYDVASEISKRIAEWQGRKPNISESAVREKLNAVYSDHRYWHLLQNIKALPSKREHHGNASIVEPASWSLRDVAVIWTQEWLFDEHGMRYDRREIKRLLTRRLSQPPLPPPRRG
jgi:hypothetical protein